MEDSEEVLAMLQLHLRLSTLGVADSHHMAVLAALNSLEARQMLLLELNHSENN